MTSNYIELLIISGLAGYCIGSIPFGLVLTRLVGRKDIRKIGSGNIGATNVLRTGSKVLALFTLILDGGKGALITFLFIEFWGFEIGLIAGLTSVIGHNFPIWLKFIGGKGVATTLGVLITVSWPLGILTCFFWLIVAMISRYSSLAALVSLGIAPIVSLWHGMFEILVLTTIFFILSVVRHTENIKNLLRGDERKISFKGRSFKG